MGSQRHLLADKQRIAETSNSEPADPDNIVSEGKTLEEFQCAISLLRSI
jgi:hypothetical protein